MKPARKIGKSKSSLRACMNSPKIGRQVNLESALERDFCCLLEFDNNVESFLEQPITIEYELDGCKKHYTPDFFVKYTQQKPTLVEVKYRDDIRKNWTILKPKFRAAKKYCERKGWQFKVYTENEIRIENYLKNIKFLLFYKHDPTLPDEAYRTTILNAIEAIKVTTPEEIILMSFRDKERQAELIPSLWKMISSGLIGCNLFNKLTMRSEIWCVTD